MPDSKILSITTNLSRYGGAQKVLMDIHNGIKDEFNSKIIGTQNYKNLHSKYEVKREDYIRFKHPWQLLNSTVLVHARNMIPIIVFLKFIFCLRSTKIIYISHNVYSTYSRFTFFPKSIISISDKVTENLIGYFKQKSARITKIYNGIKDENVNGNLNIPSDFSTIKILYPARVNNVKRQIDILKNIGTKLNDKIEIHFAGVGEDYEGLLKLCKSFHNFKCLGFVKDMDVLIPKYHFVMLYSLQEGLPISLLEGIMFSKPLLVNDVGGNLEIGIPSKNAVELTEDWDVMASQLNSLSNIDLLKYKEMCIASRQLYLKRFHLSLMITNYKSLIKKINETK